MILIDTSVWGRAASKMDSRHDVAIRAIQYFMRHGPALVVAAQTLFEFYVVATRPVDRNGLGWNPDRALQWLSAMRRIAQLLPEDARLLDEWTYLMTTHQTQGKPAHDARLVAAMRVFGVNSILTFNPGDFVRYPIAVIDPASILAA